MDYKELLHITLKLLSSPAKAWEEIALQTDKRSVYMGFVYPMIGLCAFAVFIGVLFTQGWEGPQSFQIAMRQCCIVVVALFGGYFLAAYTINEMGIRMFGLPSDLLQVHQFTGYSLVVLFLLQMITGILPDFQIIAWVLQFYTFYVVWEGIPFMTKVEESQRVRYTIGCGILLILCPTIIQMVFSKLTTILN